MDAEPVGMGFIIAVSLGACALAVIVHEGGHWLFGRLAGLHIRWVEVGSGPLLARIPLGLTVLRVRLLPLTGCVAMYPNFAWGRPSVVAFIAGGALANLLCAAACFSIVPDYDRSPHGHIACVAFGLFQALFAALVVPPYRPKGGLASDGRQLLDTLRTGPGENRTLTVAYRTIVRERYGAPDAPASALAHVVVHALLHLAPDRPGTDQNAIAKPLSLRQRNHLPLTLLTRTDLAPAERAALLDLVVSTQLRFDPCERLDALDRWSKELISIAPHAATARGTRGSVLVLLRHPEGRRLIEQDGSSDDVFDRLMRGTFQARALLEEGDREGAGALAAEARADLERYDPAVVFPILERLEAELAMEP